MKFVKASLLVLLALLIIASAAALWVVNTRAGAQWAFERAAALMPQPVEVEQIAGTIAGTLALSDLRYGAEDAGVILHAERVRLQLALTDLLRGVLHVEDAHLTGVRVTFPETKQQPQKTSDTPLDLRAPIDIAVDHLRLREGTLRRAGEPVLDVHTLVLGGRWTHDGIFLDTLSLRAEQGQMSLAGALKRDRLYALETWGTFRWRLGGTVWAGTVSGETNDGSIDAQIALSEPADARLSLALAQRPRLRWSLRVDVPETSVNELIPGATIQTLSATLQGRGGSDAGTLHGSVVLDDIPLQLDPWLFTVIGPHLQVDAITRIGSRNGKVRINGEIALEQAPADAELQALWNDVELPAAWIGQRLNTDGQLTITAGPREYSARGTLSIGPPGKLADVALYARGSRRQVHIEQLTVRQPSGNLTAQGRITLEPALEWDLDASANDFNPGALFSLWPGSLSFALATHGGLINGRPHGELHIDNLHGRLREHPVSGTADIQWQPHGVPSGKLRLRSGDSHILLTAEPGARWNVSGRLAVSSLGAWVPQANGSARSRFSLTGSWPRLNVTASLRATDVEVGAISIDSARANVSGSLASHRVEVDIDGKPISLSLTATGTHDSARGARWLETIRKLTIKIPPLDPFSLQQPASVSVHDGAVRLEQACLAHDGHAYAPLATPRVEVKCPCTMSSAICR